MLELITVALALLAAGISFAFGARYGFRAGSERERKAAANWFAEVERVRELKRQTGDQRQYVVEVDQQGVASSYPLDGGLQ